MAFSPRDRALIEGPNALRLFPRLAAALGAQAPLDGSVPVGRTPVG